MAEMLKYQGFDDTGDVASRMTHLEGFGLRPSEVPGSYQGVDQDTVSQQSSQLITTANTTQLQQLAIKNRKQT